jgi:hypothetical protein
MIPIAHACAAAGHAVAVAAPASFADSVAKSGLAHLPFPDVPPRPGTARPAALHRGSRRIAADMAALRDVRTTVAVLEELASYA